jgi:hypothetical protein
MDTDRSLDRVEDRVNRVACHVTFTIFDALQLLVVIRHLQTLVCTYNRTWRRSAHDDQPDRRIAQTFGKSASRYNASLRGPIPPMMSI